MELRGETTIGATRERVWAALNDPDVLARAIDGVEQLDRESDTRFSGKLLAAVGPVKAKFAGTVELQELDPPNHYVLVGEGKGGVAGFVKGRAEVTLQDADDGGTRLAYVAKAQVGGKLAQLGTRLIEGTARGYAERFFDRLKAEVETPAAASASDQAASDKAASAAEGVSTASEEPGALVAGQEAADGPAGLPPSVWLTVLVVLVVLLLVFLWR